MQDSIRQFEHLPTAVGRMPLLREAMRVSSASTKHFVIWEGEAPAEPWRRTVDLILARMHFV